MDLANRVALITGGKRMGQAVAEALARRGVDVALSFGRSRVEAEQAADAVRSAGRRAVVLQGDVALADACDALVAATAREFGGLDILINMASVYRETPFERMTVTEWDAVLAVDLRAAFLCARAAVPEMRKRGGGRIINVSDWVAASGRPRYRGFLPYYVAKAGVIALTEALALELARDHVLVNAIAPGPILPPAGMSQHEIAAVERATPLGRWGGAAEVARTIVALLESDFITGETVRVDGGRHLQ